MKLTKYFIVLFILSKLLISCTKEDVSDIKAADQTNHIEKTFASGDDDANPIKPG